MYPCTRAHARTPPRMSSHRQQHLPCLAQSLACMRSHAHACGCNQARAFVPRFTRAAAGARSKVDVDDSGCWAAGSRRGRASPAPAAARRALHWRPRLTSRPAPGRRAQLPKRGACRGCACPLCPCGPEEGGDLRTADQRSRCALSLCLCHDPRHGPPMSGGPRPCRDPSRENESFSK